VGPAYEAFPAEESGGIMAKKKDKKK